MYHINTVCCVIKSLVRKKPVSPAELAKSLQQRGPFNLYLDVKNMDKITALSIKDGVSVSRIVDSAISYYLESLDKSNHKD